MTKLPKNYNFDEREKHWQDFWDSEKIYQFDENSDKEIYSVDTPPPYVSAEHLHAGHIMSYSQAEFVVRFKRMQGYNVFYPMGFDDNGLPTERYVEKKYKIKKSKINRDEFIDLCLKETEKGAQNYRELWTKLGISVDWSKTYSTINQHSRKISQWSFIDLYQKKKVKRKEEPIYWCPRCQTALAQAELDDKSEKSILNYINFKGPRDEELTIATTRPELLPACVALFVNPKDKRYKNIISKQAEVPLFKHKVEIMAEDSVDMEYGTGLMMVCTWGDSEDVRKWKEHKLGTRQVIDEKGIMTENAGKFQGLTLIKAREEIVKDLNNKKLLIKQDNVEHVMNVHDRCDTPAEFIISKQWFIDILGEKEKLLQLGKDLNWFPQSMFSRYRDWVESLKWDWCISRDRYYGVPFPVWYCKDCEAEILPDIGDLPIDPTLDKPNNKCKCGSNKFIPESHVMDTWMTSSLTPLIASKLVDKESVQEKLYPMSLRPQAFEIIRTWLFYTVVKSYYHYNKLPFKDVMISGHGLDNKGKKISKSLGNFKDPNNILKQYGADALRYWTTGAKLGENMRYNEKEIQKGKRTVTKLWNAAKFAFMHLENYYPKQDNKFEAADIWILNKANRVIDDSTKYYEQYSYSKARTLIDDFFWKNFADNYMEFIKYRLYSEEKEMEESKQAAKYTLYNIILILIKLYAPILPYITEEIYQAYFKDIEKNKSIHISVWPKQNKDWKLNINQEKEFNQVLDIVEEIRKYKSEKQISMGKEIDSYTIKNKNIPNMKYKKFIENVLRIKKITNYE